MSHTKGPWTQEHDGSVCMAGQVVMQPRNCAPDNATAEEQRANAALICAAPELLAACKLAFQRSCDRLNSRAKWTAEDQRVHAALIAAIAKAQGRG